MFPVGIIKNNPTPIGLIDKYIVKLKAKMNKQDNLVLGGGLCNYNNLKSMLVEKPQ